MTGKPDIIVEPAPTQVEVGNHLDDEKTELVIEDLGKDAFLVSVVDQPEYNHFCWRVIHRKGDGTRGHTLYESPMIPLSDKYPSYAFYEKQQKAMGKLVKRMVLAERLANKAKAAGLDK